MKPGQPQDRAYDVAAVRDSTVDRFSDRLAAEEPMEVRVRWQSGGRSREKSVAVTMLTPGDDFELAAGFQLTERVIGGRDEIVDIAYCLDVDEPQERNVVTVTLAPGVALDVERLQRNFFASSSCGVCGKATLEALDLDGCHPIHDTVTVSANVLRSLPERMRAAQGVFTATGGLHAAAAFAPEGELMVIREDVGRHNAVDKVAGERLMNGESLRGCVLVVSGRAGYEIVQKALVAGAPVVAAIGAPSSLAVDVARRFGITLIGFLREDRYNVYSRADRLKF